MRVDPFNSKINLLDAISYTFARLLMQERDLSQLLNLGLALKESLLDEDNFLFYSVESLPLLAKNDKKYLKK